MSNTPSVRANVITRRTYSRPLEDGAFETWNDTVARVIAHQSWLWRRAKGADLNETEMEELAELRQLMLGRKVLPSGRTLWLGGTDVAKTREASQFNCSFGRVETVSDVVDAFWLLLQGCGVGFEPVVGTLSGFSKPARVTVVRSRGETTKGHEDNRTKAYTANHLRVWHLTVGDSAEAWAKAVGKLLAFKERVDEIVLDFSEIRAAGIRLKGYGWISSGDETLASALQAICAILNKRAGDLLSRMDILDILNHLGTTLSSRRSAEIALVPYGDPEWQEFATAKKDHWVDNAQRAQSNNSLLFYQKPHIGDLYDIFSKIEDGGGSEPGFINAQAALKRAKWFKGVNPCAEILLGSKSFCNLVEVDVAKFNHSLYALGGAMYLAGRMNYRQTCVSLKDGILQDTWHELNETLRLCGVGITGIVRWLSGDPEKDARALRFLKERARAGAFSMADELGLPRPKAVTTVKPSGTLSKIMDTTEGVHRPLGRFIFNNVRFSIHDPAVAALRAAGYRTFADPYTTDAVLVTLPVEWAEVSFEVKDGVPVNLESALAQLARYKLLMDNYVDHNCSITVSYSLEEVPGIVRWIDANWDHYVGVSFIYRNDPTKTAQDLGYPFLPQEVVDEKTFRDYTAGLQPVVLDGYQDEDELVAGDGCATGACPIR
jgi:adenosylcobalamin-dependent ribonucleoside-triphosphate reductase